MDNFVHFIQNKILLIPVQLSKLGEIGGGKPEGPPPPGGYPMPNRTAPVDSLNSLFISAGIAIGIVMLVIGVIKLIMAFSDENPKGKMDASVFLGVGGVFLSMPTVVNLLNINSSTTVTSITTKILNVIQLACNISGLLLLVITIFLFILAILQEQPEAMAKASTMSGVSIGLLSVGTLVKTITDKGIIEKIDAGTDASSAIVEIIVPFITKSVWYIGITLCVIGSFKLVYGFRNEDVQERNTALKIISVGLILTIFRAVLKTFGI